MENRVSAYMAELIGTMILVIGGCGAIIFGGPTLSNLAISLAFGLSVLMMAYTLGPVSGCHLNPAVSVAMVLLKKMDVQQCILYILAQCFGAAIGGALLLIMCSFHMQGFNLAELSHYGFASNGYGIHSPGQYGLISCFVAEVVLTAIFILVVLATTRKEFPAGFGGLVVGLALVVVHLVGIQITGTSVNPARSFGVALYKGGEALTQLWLFIVAPITGSIVSVILHHLLWKK